MTNNGFVYFKTRYASDQICVFEQDNCDFFDLYDFIEAFSAVSKRDKYELVKELISSYGCTYVSKRPYISFNQVKKFFDDNNISGYCYEVENEYGGDNGF